MGKSSLNYTQGNGNFFPLGPCGNVDSVCRKCPPELPVLHVYCLKTPPLQRLLLSRLAKPASLFRCMQQPCVLVQQGIIKMLNFLDAEASPLDSSVHPIPAFLLVSLSFLYSLTAPVMWKPVSHARTWQEWGTKAISISTEVTRLLQQGLDRLGVSL